MIHTVIVAGIPMAAIIWFLVRRAKWSKVRYRYGRILIVTGITTNSYMPIYLALMSLVMAGMALLAIAIVLLITFFVDFFLFTMLLKLKSREALITSLVGAILLFPFIMLAMLSSIMLWFVFTAIWLSPLP